MTKFIDFSSRRKRIAGIFVILILAAAGVFFFTFNTGNTPIGIVKQYLKDMGNNFGVISLSINSVKEVTDKQHIQNILQDEDARKMELEAKNIALVDACIRVEYDNTKVPANSNENECLRFVLVRENETRPWLIAEYGQGLGGIPFIDFQKPAPMKGMELYVWKNRELTGSDKTYFTLLDGTNRNKTESEIYDLSIAVDSLDWVNRELSGYPDLSYLAIYQMNDIDFTKQDMSDIADKIIINADNHQISIGLWQPMQAAP